ncbi:ABC-three component system protein [Anderseniella sp. Alg231-50]|uniref:ABC-three component system protein n=1 Tax=Anderseniella sp. Alg231-50 TaxID=1922226 RepID=UPI000D54AEBE
MNNDQGTGPNIDQSHATAGQDIVGGNKYDFSNHKSAYEAIEALASKLKQEVADEATVQHTIRNLAYYKRRKEAGDGIVGLEAKLKAGGRLDLWDEDALDQKVEFEMLLETWSMYASAQEIFAHMLAKVERAFKQQIKPKLPDLSHDVADSMVDKLVLNPIIDECSKINHFFVNVNVALGMLYWLADHCFIRWHE